MKHATTRELYEYWNRVRGAERAPLRSAIEPSDIRQILGEMFILEVVERDNYFVRLAGTRICALYCREIKGTNLLDLWSGEDRQAMATLAAAVSEDGAAAVVTITAETARDQEVACELILLPLRHGGTTFDRILGSCAAMERPYWLGSEPIVRQKIASLQAHLARRDTGLHAAPVDRIGARPRSRPTYRRFACLWPDPGGAVTFSSWTAASNRQTNGANRRNWRENALVNAGMESVTAY